MIDSETVLATLKSEKVKPTNLRTFIGCMYALLIASIVASAFLFYFVNIIFDDATEFATPIQIPMIFVMVTSIVMLFGFTIAIIHWSIVKKKIQDATQFIAKLTIIYSVIILIATIVGLAIVT